MKTKVPVAIKFPKKLIFSAENQLGLKELISASNIY